jgi:hypothetical protein
MKIKLLILAAVLGISALTPKADAIGYGRCDSSCPTSTGLCTCPSWTDRSGATAYCKSWNTVGGCWYE